MKKIIFIILTFLLSLSLINTFTIKAQDTHINATDVNYFQESALIPNSNLDQSSKLSNILNKMKNSDKILFIPKGTYLINQSIQFTPSIKVEGDIEGATILKNNTSNTVLMSYLGYQRQSNVSFKNLNFEGISIYMRLTNNVTFENNVFYNPNIKNVIELEANSNVTIKNNIFLRSKDHADLTYDNNRTIIISGYATTNYYEHSENNIINDNLFGGKIDELESLKNISSPELKQTIQRLQNSLSKNEITLANDQNYMITAINSFRGLKNTDIKRNIMYSAADNIDFESHKIVLDHAIYLRGAQDINIVSNHVRGFGNGPFGGIKFKSGRNITVMNNYIRNGGLIFYGTHEYGLAETYEEGRYSELSGFLIANNTFDFKKWEDFYSIGTDYKKDNGNNNVFNNVFFDNKYINYDNIKSNLRRDFLLVDTVGGINYSFPPNSTYVKNNTRDDLSREINVEKWVQSDYDQMPSDWKSLIPDTKYLQYKDDKIPFLDSLATPINQSTEKGINIDVNNLVNTNETKDDLLISKKIISDLDFHNKVGVHDIIIQLDYQFSKTVYVTVKVTVVDTIAPVISGNDITYDLNSSISEEQFLTDISAKTDDNSLITSDFLNVVNFKKVDTYKVTLSSKDQSNNISTKLINVTIKDSNSSFVSFENKITYESHEKISEEQFYKDINLVLKDGYFVTSNFSTVDFKKAKDYSVILTSNNKQRSSLEQKTVVITIKDEIIPSLTFFKNINYPYNSLKTENEFFKDINLVSSEESIFYSNFNLIDFSKPKVYEIQIYAIDLNNNKSEVHVVYVNVLQKENNILVNTGFIFNKNVLFIEFLLICSFILIRRKKVSVK